MSAAAIKVAALGFTLCSLACSLKPERSGVSLAPPAEVEWIATVHVLDSGEIISATPLLPRREQGAGFAPLAGPQSGSVFAVGYTAKQVDLLIMGEPGGASVRAPKANEIVLPRPTWVAQADASQDVLRFVAGATAPALTTETIATCGPRIRHVDERCRTGVCTSSVSASSCGFAVQLGCGAGVLSVEYEADQGLGPEKITGRYRTCETDRPPEGANHRFRCNDGSGYICVIDLYPQIKPSAPTYQSVVRLNGAIYEDIDDLKHGRRGSITDAAPTATGILTAEYSAGFNEVCQQPGDLVWRSEGQEDFRLSLPDCPTAITPAGDGSFWVGAVDQQGCSRIARYNQGGMLQQTSLECDLLRHALPSDIVLSHPDQGALLVVLYNDEDVGELESAGFLLQLAQADLQPIADIVIADRARRAAYSEGQWVALAGNDFLTVIEVGSATATPELDFDLICSNEVRGTFLELAPDGFWILGVNEGGVVARITARGECAYARSYYGFDIAFSSVVEWRGQTFAGGVRISDGQGIMAGLDPSGSRLLPSYFEMGYGPPTELVVGGDGALWAVMGFRGELLRFSAP